MVFFEGVSVNSQVWMSHSDSVKALPTNGVKLASTHDVEFAVKLRVKRPMIQYHPEVFFPQTDKMKILVKLLRFLKILLL
jgi:GMP synthase (glutamine-hydrolysing)